MVAGVDRLRAQLNRVPEKILTAVVEVMEAEVDKMVAQMKGVVPVEDGDLQASIGWRWGSRKTAAPKGAMVIAEFKGKVYGRLVLTIFAGQTRASFHGVFQEFGTSKMAANPFFYPVFRANKARIRGALSRAVRKGAAG